MPSLSHFNAIIRKCFLLCVPQRSIYCHIVDNLIEKFISN